MYVGKNVQLMMTPTLVPAVVSMLSVSDYIQIAIGLIALLVAFIGPLMSEHFKYTFRSPKNKILFKLGSPFCHKTTTDLGIDVYFFRIAVKNEGKLAAEDCSTYLESISKKDSSGDFIEEKNFTPIILNWSAKYNQEIRVLTIQSGNMFFVDIGSIANPATCKPSSKYRGYSSEEKEKTMFFLESKDIVFAQKDCLTPGDYKLKICVYAKNASPSLIELKLSWSGQWKDDTDDMFQQIVIKR